MTTELPPGICSVIDRHSKQRWRFRMAGRWPCYITGTPGTDEFNRQYCAACDDFMPDDAANARRQRARAASAIGRQQRERSIIAGASAGNWIYVVGGNRGPVKIGWTTNLKSRLIRLQTGSPEKLRLLALCQGTRADEANLHHRFAPHRLTGEWFARADDVREFIRQNRPRLTNRILSNLNQNPQSLENTG